MRHCDYIALTGCPKKDACIFITEGGGVHRFASRWGTRAEIAICVANSSAPSAQRTPHSSVPTGWLSAYLIADASASGSVALLLRTRRGSCNAESAVGPGSVLGDLRSGYMVSTARNRAWPRIMRT